MPKKTKKQKLLAQLHRKINLVSSSPSNIVKREFPEKSFKEEGPKISGFTYNKQVIIKPQITMADRDYRYIRSDLIKITIFTFLALSFQSVLYFVLRTR